MGEAVGKAAFLGRAQGVCAAVCSTSHSEMGRVQGTAGASDLEMLADSGPTSISFRSEHFDSDLIRIQT